MKSAAKKGNENKEMATTNFATYITVSSLLATSVMYAGFAMHRHVQSDYGPAILTRKGAFMVFVVSEAMTLILSMFSLFLAILYWRNKKRYGDSRKSQKLATLYYSVTMLVLIGMQLVSISSNYVLYVLRLGKDHIPESDPQIWSLAMNTRSWQQRFMNDCDSKYNKECKILEPPCTSLLATAVFYAGFSMSRHALMCRVTMVLQY